MLRAERFVDLTCLIEPPDPLAGLEEGDAHARVLVLVPARADAEVEPPLGDYIRRDGDLRQDGRVTVRVARDHQANAEAIRCRGERGECLPAFEAGAVQMPVDRRVVVEEPCMLDAWDAIGLLPDRQHFLVGDILRRGLEPEA